MGCLSLAPIQFLIHKILGVKDTSRGVIMRNLQFFALVRTGFTIVGVDGNLDFSETQQMERLLYAVGVQLNSSLG